MFYLETVDHVFADIPKGRDIMSKCSSSDSPIKSKKSVLKLDEHFSGSTKPKLDLNKFKHSAQHSLKYQSGPQRIIRENQITKYPDSLANNKSKQNLRFSVGNTTLPLQTNILKSVDSFPLKKFPTKINVKKPPIGITNNTNKFPEILILSNSQKNIPNQISKRNNIQNLGNQKKMIPKIRQHVLNSNQSKFVTALNLNPNKIKSIVKPLTFPLNNVIKQKVST